MGIMKELRIGTSEKFNFNGGLCLAEENVKAVKGSIITDITNGNVYTKTTETSINTGWVKLN